MKIDYFSLPTQKEIQNHCISSLSKYWKNKKNLIYNLQIKRVSVNILPGTPLKLESILLPDWAKQCGINNHILVPVECLSKNYSSNSRDPWKEVDWFLAIFLMLECWHERLWEKKFGSIHSYSFKLKGWDKRAWDYAWVNRIGLFLKEWVAFESKDQAKAIFGKLDKTNIKMTHDVDAIKKTWSIRFKQTTFMLFNSFRSLLNGKFYLAAEKLKKSFSFFFTNENWMVFDKIFDYLKDANITSTFHFYADLQKKNFKKIIFDPGYKVNSKALRKIISDILSNKHEIGLHPGFESWENAEDIIKQKKDLENVSGISISNVRQHWLRFSWSSTWSCQQLAELELDTTLMFNDRPGFRNSSCLLWCPWDENKKKAYNLKAMPSILMDSHIYDYLELNNDERINLMDNWIRECKEVFGDAAVLWHPHTMTKSYGWTDGFLNLIKIIKKK